MLIYNLIGASAEFTILRFFWKDLKPSILAKLQNKNFELKSFIYIVKKIVVDKAKANLWSWATTKNIEQHCF